MSTMIDNLDGCVDSKMASIDASITADGDNGEMAGSQPATQPLPGHEQNEESESSQDDDAEDENFCWGMLYPLVDNWRPIELRGSEVTVGRASSNTHVITKEQAGHYFLRLSSVHFAIRRRSAGEGVVLTDRSLNGTWINGAKVGKHKQRQLEHNSLVTLVEEPAVYVYVSSDKAHQRQFPADMRREYAVSREVGRGAAGVVCMAFRRRDGQRFAVKSINLRRCSAVGSHVPPQNEVDLLRAVDHPGIIRLENVFKTDEALHIVLEYADGGELFDKIIAKKAFDEREARVHFYQIVSAIEYLHGKNIAHRDLKPENILLANRDNDRPVVKLTDMGLAKRADISSLKTLVGTPQYLAPEILLNKIRPGDKYSVKVDMWSLGVVLYAILSGMPPFDADRKDKDLMRQILTVDFAFPGPRWARVSDEAKDLVKKLIVFDPEERLSAKDALLHPWVQVADDVATAEAIMDSQRFRRCPKRPASNSAGDHLQLPENRAANANGLGLQPPPPKRVRRVENFSDRVCDMDIGAAGHPNA